MESNNEKIIQLNNIKKLYIDWQSKVWNCLYYKVDKSISGLYWNKPKYGSILIDFNNDNPNPTIHNLFEVDSRINEGIAGTVVGTIFGEINTSKWNNGMLTRWID